MHLRSGATQVVGTSLSELEARAFSIASARSPETDAVVRLQPDQPGHILVLRHK